MVDVGPRAVRRLAVLLSPMTVLVHELGHAVVARWHGVTVDEVVVMPEGRTVAVRIGGIPIRMGLGLKRELRSTAPGGWVRPRPGEISDRALIQILLAGPIAQGLFGAMMLAARSLAPPPDALRSLLLIGGILALVGAVRNLQADADGRSDGARVRQLRRGAAAEPRARPRVAKPPTPCRAPEDPHTATFVPPPSHKRATDGY
jgi:hypothetical protein